MQALASDVEHDEQHASIDLDPIDSMAKPQVGPA